MLQGKDREDLIHRKIIYTYKQVIHGKINTQKIGVDNNVNSIPL